MEGLSHPLFWKTVNTIILFAILYYILRKPISKFYNEGINGVIAKFEDAKLQKEEALKLLKEAEEKSKKAKEEAERIIKVSEELSERQKQDVIEKARKEKLNILKATDEQIEREVDKAKAELRDFAAKKSIEIARKKLKSKVNENVNRKLVENSLQSI